MIVLDVLFIHDIHDQGLVIGPIDGDRLTRQRADQVERPTHPVPQTGNTMTNNQSRAQLAPLMPREDRVTLWRILRLIFNPRKGRHS